jgi:lipoate-protein ligase A
MKCCILPDQVNSGPANMALDEALLESVGPDVFFRTYGWAVPTLSLGYFQRVADLGREERWKEVALVRRPTGGGAIWHDHELTYAVILPASHPQARSGVALYHAVHGAILGLLRDRGLEARRRGEADPPREQGRPAGPRPFLCFADRDAEDLVCRGFKVLGSAQRKRRGAILQHGSLLLRGSARTPELRGICELGDVPWTPQFWARQVERRVLAALGLEPSPWSIPENIRRRAGELENLVYRDPGWTNRR